MARPKHHAVSFFFMGKLVLNLILTQILLYLMELFTVYIVLLKYDEKYDESMMKSMMKSIRVDFTPFSKM